MEVLDFKKIKASDIANKLKQGKVLMMPTETAYGLVASSLNDKAVKKIYKIKKRDKNKSLPLVCSSLGQVMNFFSFPRVKNFSWLKIARQHWPGPLSLQLKSKHKLAVPDLNGTHIVRVSGDKFLRQLARLTKTPLTATSANLSGQGEVYQLTDFLKQTNQQQTMPDFIIDKGKIPKTKPSTILGVVAGQVSVLRPGPIKINLKK